MTTTKSRAEALSGMLSTFNSISGQSLQKVRQGNTEGSLDKLILDFDSVSLAVVADEDNDSIDIRVAEEADCGNACIDASHLGPWNRFVGIAFGWGWVTVNQQGYCDGLLLSFGGIIPQLVLNVIASSIKVRLIATSPAT